MKLKSILDFLFLVYCSLFERVGLISCPFFLLIIFLYLYNMEQFTKAELYGKTLELQYENEQLKNQLILNLKNNE